MKRGEVWWVDDAPRAGRRPHLVLSRDRVLLTLVSVIAVPATRTVRGIPTEVALGVDDGMPEECALALDSLTVMARERFGEPICTLSRARMNEVCRALARATGCT
ncbi:MAG: type II toxin-antitoxin system PemK/MazF family toxin [Gaiella sp.]